MMIFLIIILNLLTVLFLPFLMIGIIKKTKAFWGGRYGASVFQPLYDFIKLIKKDFVISNTTSTIFRLTPLISFAAIIIAAVFVPLISGTAIINIPAGLIVFAYLLALGKFFNCIGAMDTGSSFEGMGTSREACFTSIVEPAFFIILGSIMALSGNYTFESLSKITTNAGSYGVLIIIFAVLALFLMVLIEGCRVPVDDPATHLELTMIHEVMILDNSGFDLALITWASGIKMLLITSLIAKIIIPTGSPLYALYYLITIFLVSIIIGTAESSMARIRMSHIFEFIFIMSSFALIVMSLVGAKVFGG